MGYRCPKCGRKPNLKDGDFPKWCKCGEVLRDNIGLFNGEKYFNTIGSYVKPVFPMPPRNRVGVDLSTQKDISCSITIDFTNNAIQSINHEHIWKPIKDSYDVECSICGIRAKRAVAYIVQE